MPILVDANIILDLWTRDPKWYDWSFQMVNKHVASEGLIVNQIICAEIGRSFETSSALMAVLRQAPISLRALPFEATVPAAHAYTKYKKRGGIKNNILADFLIGAHAEVEDLTILTRDQARFRSYFPAVTLISP